MLDVMTVILNPILHFRDNAREAMEFYQTVFGGELDVMTFASRAIRIPGRARRSAAHSRPRAASR